MMRSKVSCGLLMSLIWVVSPEAFGQSRSFDAHFFKPALYSGGIFAVDRAASPTKWQPGLKFSFTHESTPLRLSFPSGACAGSVCLGKEDIIPNAQVFNFMAQFAIASWLEFGLDIPMARQSYVTNPAAEENEGYELLTASDLKTNVGNPNVSPLDFRTGFKITFLEKSGLALALSVEGTLPFGDEIAFNGEQGFTLHPRLLTSLDIGSLGLALNVGYRFREQTVVYWNPGKSGYPLEWNADPKGYDYPLLSVDDELTFGLGAIYQFHPVIGVGAELFGAVPTSGGGDFEMIVSRRLEPDPSKCPAGHPAGIPCEIVTTRQEELSVGGVVAELLGGVLINPLPGLTVAVGAGGGLTGDMRQVAFRLFSLISWLPGAEAPAVGFQDRDGDGIPDHKDECPDRAEDKDGFQDSDGCPDADNDGDGIPDTEDRCPNQAEDRDGFQDNDGCPDADNDGDGIADADDQCPNEPETKNSFQDADGCPDNAPTGVAVGKGKITIPENIQFTTGKADTAKASHNLLDEIAKKIVANPQAGKIRIEGHCDATGSAAANQRLSQARAEAVMRYLIGKGVPADRLQAVGYGLTRPVGPNNTAEGRAKNRRVEFILLQQQK